MSDKLLEALQAVVKEIQSMHPTELTEALKEASTSEFSQTIDILNHFTSSVRLVRSLSDNTLSLILPIEDIPSLSKSDTEDQPNTGLVSKTPYRDITTYREEWHVLDNTYKNNKDK